MTGAPPCSRAQTHHLCNWLAFTPALRARPRAQTGFNQPSLIYRVKASLASDANTRHTQRQKAQVIFCHGLRTQS
ncbi:MAG: hypothetical protein PCALPYG88_7314 [uncultured Paraburkholderia sp.]|nr:MAG: hypothetical protein PCALPYG08_7146 [uncultured Paraburkholderia sp.]CAH2943191.1 MAG: hypothetical protein PCALPYG88_7314 [uncultured Paraburkholderia sp.]